MTGTAIQLQTTNPLEIAHTLRRGFDVGERVPGLWWGNGTFYRWYGGDRWVRESVEDMTNELWRLLGISVVVTGAGTSVETRRQYTPSTGKVKDVMAALKAVCQMPGSELPRWLIPGEGRPDPRKVMVFRNAIIDIEASARAGQMVAVGGGWEWLGTTALTTTWDPEAKCPTWERCLKEWSDGDEVWGELLERSFAACLMGYRDWGRMLVQYGATRAGKGTSTRVLKKLMQKGCVVGVGPQQAVGQYGAEIVCEPDVVIFTDVGALDDVDGRKLAELLRQMMGGDGTSFSRKYGAIARGVEFRSFPIVQTHYVPDLPNEQGGLTEKMNLLHFRKSFAGAPDLGLSERLGNELAGVARRLAEAAVRLVAAPAGERWPITQEGSELKRRIQVESSPADAFILAQFKVDGNGWVHGDEVKKARMVWEKVRGIKLRSRRGTWVPDENLLTFLVENSSVGVARYKHQGRWGLRGINCLPVGATGQGGQDDEELLVPHTSDEE